MVENSVNNTNRVAKPNVGVIIPPNEIAGPDVYNSYAVRKRMNALQRDIYQAEKATKFEDTKATPKSLLVAITMVAGGALIWKTKVIPKLINLFKNKPPTLPAP